MDAQSDGNDDGLAAVKEVRQQLESRMETLHNTHIDLIASLQTLVPDLVSSLDLSLKVISSINGRPFSPIPKPLPTTTPAAVIKDVETSKLPLSDPKFTTPVIKQNPSQPDKFLIEDSSGGPLSLLRSMVAVCLLQRVPFEPINSSTILRKLENDPSLTAAERAALRDVGGGESGSVLMVEMALKSMEEDNGGVDLEEFVVSGKPGVMVMNIDRTRLLKELPETKELYKQKETESDEKNRAFEVGKVGGDTNYSGSLELGRPIQSDSLKPGTPFNGGSGPWIGGPRGMAGMMGMPRGVGVPPPMQWQSTVPPMLNGLNGSPGAAAAAATVKPKTDEDEMKDLEALVNKKTFLESQKSKTGEELLDLIQRPTAREIAVAKRFQSIGGSQVKEYCTALTKEDCRSQNGSYFACDKVHFRRIIAQHTDTNLGDCSFLDTCRHMKTCKYVHYELDSTLDVSSITTGSPALTPPKPLKRQRADYCSEVELGEAQWINCDIRSFRMDILGQFGVIMADPPWDIHMELPYGTMADNEMRTLNVPALQTDGLIFLWVTGRAMELGRECLELWGYRSIEEIIWVKTNQLQRIIRTGRTGHWLNHSKEHCLVGIKGNPEVNRNIDTDVIVAEVRETSRKPDEMYSMLERIMPRARKLELFARMHNCHAGWMSLGNQLNGVRLVEEGLRARFKAACPDVEVQPPSPPRSSAMELSSGSAQARKAFGGDEFKTSGDAISSSGLSNASQEKPVNVSMEMTG